MASLLLFLVPLALLWVLLIRPQQQRMRQAQAMVASLEIGDEIVTTGGIYGTITDSDDNSLWVEIAPDVVVRVSRAAVATRAPADDLDDGVDDDDPDDEVDELGDGVDHDLVDGDLGGDGRDEGDDGTAGNGTGGPSSAGTGTGARGSAGAVNGVAPGGTVGASEAAKADRARRDDEA